MTTDSTGSRISEPLPERISQYLIKAKLGAGGMGTVYLGENSETHKLAAIKVLPASMAREQGFIDRFEREIAAMHKMQSSNIVEMYESGEDNGTYFYAMEYVPGETLTDRLIRDKRIPWREAIDIGVQICRALKAAHNTGIIHRDLKPSNLLLGENGIVKLTDFGIAQVFASSKLTVTGGILGTAEYMSPEQAQGKRANKQSDIYSLGAVMYVMLTGRPPFTGKTTLDIVQKHKYSNFDAPRRIVPEIPFWLDEIVCKCLSKKPEDRYPDAYVLNLRLQEVPKKVDMANSSGTFDVDGTSPTSETIADGTGLGSYADVEASVLFRDLLKAQLEGEKIPSSTLGKLLDNTWVLIGLLLLLIGGGAVLYKLNRPNPDHMFAQGAALMQQKEGPAWDAASRDYFIPLLELDPETWEGKISPFMQQIELYNFKKELLGKQITQLKSPETQPEAVLRQVVELRKLGRIREARSRLQSLMVLLEGNERFTQYHDLAEKLLDDLPVTEQTIPNYEFLDASLTRADKFLEAKEPEKARIIWQSIIDLYASDPDAAVYVNKAKEQLNRNVAE